MNFASNIRAFLRGFPLKKLSGHQKFLALAAHIAAGDVKYQVEKKVLVSSWLKSILGTPYNPVYYIRAQSEGWVDPSSKPGFFKVTKEGLNHLADVHTGASKSFDPGSKALKEGLVIFQKREAYSFDKYLRKLLATAKHRILIADSYVGNKIFETVLDAAPKSIPLHLIFNNNSELSSARAKRFQIGWQQFVMKRYKFLHDRFMIVDNAGYVIGPSLKDAAEKSPALIVALNSPDSKKLHAFFDTIWRGQKTFQL